MADGKAGMQGSQRDIKTSGMGRMGGRNLSLFCEGLKDVKVDVVALERKCGQKQKYALHPHDGWVCQVFQRGDGRW